MVEWITENMESIIFLLGIGYAVFDWSAQRRCSMALDLYAHWNFTLFMYKQLIKEVNENIDRSQQLTKTFLERHNNLGNDSLLSKAEILLEKYPEIAKASKVVKPVVHNFFKYANEVVGNSIQTENIAKKGKELLKKIEKAEKQLRVILLPFVNNPRRAHLCFFIYRKICCKTRRRKRRVY